MKQKQNKIYVIAYVMSEGKLVGVRITDLCDGKHEVKSVSLQDLARVYKAYPNMFMNIGLKDGLITFYKVKFAQINEKGRHITDKTWIVANKLGNVGYTFICSDGKVKKLRSVDSLTLCKEQNVCNVLVNDNPIRLVPIDSDLEFETIKLSKSTVDTSINNLKIGLVMNKNKKIVSVSEAEVQNNLTNEDKDIVGLSDKQIQALQAYYLWYTTDAYSFLSENRVFKLKENKAIILSKLKKDYEWHFAGIIDGWFKGAFKCTLGHPLRYKYIVNGYATHEDYLNRKIAQVIEFGEECHADFFEIPREELAKLKKIRKFMSEELNLITEAKRAEVEDSNGKYWSTLWSSVDFLRKVVEDKNIILLTKMFGSKVAQTLKLFTDLDIPYPDSLVKKACEEAYGNSEYYSDKNRAKEFIRMLVPREYHGTLDELQALGDCYFKDVWEKLFRYTTYYALGGYYAYNPLENTGKRYGAFNKETRYARAREIQPFKLIGLGIGSTYGYSQFMRAMDLLQYIFYIKPYYTEEVKAEITSDNARKYNRKIVEYMYCYESAFRSGGFSDAIHLMQCLPYMPEVKEDKVDVLARFLNDISEVGLIGLIKMDFYKKIGINFIKFITQEAGSYRKTLKSGLTISCETKQIGNVKNIHIKFGDYEYSFLNMDYDKLPVEALVYLGKEIDLQDSLVVQELKEAQKQKELETTRVLDRLENAFKSLKGDTSDYRENIIKDMFNRGKKYEGLSEKQKYIVDSYLNHETPVSNNSLSSEDKQTIKGILEKCKQNEKLAVHIKSKSAIALEVLNTVIRNGYMTDKQRKYMNIALELTNNFKN